MKIFVTGANGLIGKRLVESLRQSGNEVTRLTRRPPTSDDERQWDPQAESMDSSVFSGCDVLVHLAGENIGEGRWNEKKKQRIRESRVASTNLLAKTIAGMTPKPQAFIVASAIGYYGDRSDEVLTEDSTAGEGYLADVCKDWELAADPARDVNIRTAHIRTGVVLAKEGGALKSMLTPFKLGVGGIMGNGKQYWSWISIEDIVRLFQFAVENESVAGAINGTAPNPCTNKEFTKALGKAISRPTIFPMPAFIAKILLGEMAKPLILASARVVPEKAQKLGFEFKQTELVEAFGSLNL